MGPLLIPILVFCFGGAVALEPTDPCFEVNHKTINDSRRSSGYEIEHTIEGLCDHTLQEGWFRFVSLAGGRMPTECVPQYHCGTRQPLWLDTTLPSRSGDEIQGRACLNTGKDCCEHYMDIAVKNCGDYFIYFLRPVPYCPIAYCAGDRTPCKDGMTSRDGFEPGCVPVATETPATTTPRPTTTTAPATTRPTTLALPQPAFPPPYTESPTISNPEVRGHSFRFVCNANYHGASDPDMAFEIQWTFNGQPDPHIPNKIVSSTNQQADLPGSQIAGHMGQQIGCRVRAFYRSNTTRHTDWKDSNQYHAQITLQATRHEVSEKGGNDTINVTSTVPIVCDSIPDDACCLHLMLDVDGPRNNLVVPHPCEVKLCAKDWNNATHTATTTFTVAAAKDQIRDGDQVMTLAFEKLGTTGGGPYVDVFQNYLIRPIQIHVKDEPTRTCTWTGDPHFTMINRRRFDLFNLGDFTVYKTHDDHFEVQSRTVHCNGHAACQCGLAIREGGDVIRIDNCHDVRQAPRVECNNHRLRHGTSVWRSRDGKNIMVYLPSGREVKVDCGSYYHNVQVTYPASDTHLAQGLCGRMDQNQDNYYHRDGSPVSSPCETRDNHGHHHGNNCNTPMGYTESWRNPPQTSLFSNPPTTTTTTTTSTSNSSGEVHYCQCDKGLSSNDPARIDCTPGADVTQHAQRCGSSTCQNVTASLPSFLQGSGWHRKRDVIYGDFDELDPPVDFGTDNDPADWDLTWPTHSGITQDTATRRCREAIEGSQLFARCGHAAANATMADILNSSISDCVTDILFGDNFNMVESAVAAFTSSCQSELAQDPANYHVDQHGNTVLMDEFNKVCSATCLQHGRCQDGACVCNQGYTGSSCQLQVGVPPTLTKLRSSALCDLNKRPCRVLYFDADNFEESDSFTCRVVSSHGQSTEEKAKFVAGNRLACPLPETNVSLTIFSVSVTTDGSHYSNSFNITVFDSTCRECSESDGCSPQPLPAACLIEDQCHQNGDHKISDATKMCNTSSSNVQWSTTNLGLYPVIEGKPTIVAPVPPDFTIRCRFASPDHATNARFRVWWVVDEARTLEMALLWGNQREVSMPMDEFPRDAHAVSCRVQSFYVNQVHSSNVYASRAIAIQMA